MDRQVLVTSEGIGIGNLKIPINEQKANEIKSQILEERLDSEVNSDLSSGTGWKLLKKNMKSKKLKTIESEESPEVGTLLITNKRSTQIKHKYVITQI
jgi:hypothetical protein